MWASCCWRASSPGAFSAVIYGLLIVGIAVVFKTVGPPVGLHLAASGLRRCPARCRSCLVVVIIICFVYNPFGGDAWGTPTEGGALGAFIVFL